jgi:hypothetical protein
MLAAACVGHGTLGYFEQTTSAKKPAVHRHAPAGERGLLAMLDDPTRRQTPAQAKPQYRVSPADQNWPPPPQIEPPEDEEEPEPEEDEPPPRPRTEAELADDAAMDAEMDEAFAAADRKRAERKRAFYAEMDAEIPFGQEEPEPEPPPINGYAAPEPEREWTPDEINAELGHDGGLLAAGEDMQRGWRWRRSKHQLRCLWMLKGKPGDWAHVPSEEPVELAGYSKEEDERFKLTYGRFPDMIRPPGESAEECSKRRRNFSQREARRKMLEQQTTELDLRSPPTRPRVTKVEALRRVVKGRTKVVDAADTVRKTEAWRDHNGKMLAVRTVRDKVRDMAQNRPEDFGYEVVTEGRISVAYLWRL